MKIAPDTETTGLLVHQKDVAFLVMTLEDPENGEDPTERLWSIEIDERTRKWADTDANKATVADCDEYFHDMGTDPSIEWIFHNAPFDLHALEPITGYFLKNFSLEDDSLERLHDTVPMSHVHDNQGTHELKELGIAYLRRQPNKRDEMVEASKACRRYDKYMPEALIGKPHSVAKEDYWLPGICAAKYPEVVERVAPSLLPFLQNGEGNRIWKGETDASIMRRIKLTPDEQKRKAYLIEECRKHLETVAPVYGMEDVHLTLQLYYLLAGLFERDDDPAQRWASYRQEQRVCWTLYQMQRRGIRVKPTKLKQKIEQFGDRIEKQLSNLRTLVGCDTLNVDSSPQMQAVFFDEDGPLGFEPLKVSDAGNASCDKTVTAALFHDTLPNLSEEDIEAISSLDTKLPKSRGILSITDEEYEEPKWEGVTEEKYALQYKRALFLRCLEDLKAHSAAHKYLKGYAKLASNRPYPYAKIRSVDGRTVFEKGSWINRREGCLYANWNGSGTAPGRLSSKHPNTQNWSKGKKDDFDEDIVKATIRDVFGPDEGDAWFSIDYQQLQVRIFAYVAQDENLIAILERGGDIHSEIAKAVFGVDEPTKAQRRAVKAITFGILFGSQPATIARRSGLADGYDRFMNYFRSLKHFMDATIRQAYKKGYVTRMDGYRLYVPHNRIYTTAVCYIIQGDEAALVKTAMVDLELALTNTPMRQLYQVHDEIGFEYLNPFRNTPDLTLTPQQKSAKSGKLQTALIEKVVSVMEGAGSKYGLVTPVDVEYTTTDLGTLKKWKPELSKAA